MGLVDGQTTDSLFASVGMSRVSSGKIERRPRTLLADRTRVGCNQFRLETLRDTITRVKRMVCARRSIQYNNNRDRTVEATDNGSGSGTENLTHVRFITTAEDGSHDHFLSPPLSLSLFLSSFASAPLLSVIWGVLAAEGRGVVARDGLALASLTRPRADSVAYPSGYSVFYTQNDMSTT